MLPEFDQKTTSGQRYIAFTTRTFVPHTVQNTPQKLASAGASGRGHADLAPLCSQASGAAGWGGENAPTVLTSPCPPAPFLPAAFTMYDPDFSTAVLHRVKLTAAPQKAWASAAGRGSARFLKEGRARLGDADGLSAARFESRT